MNEDRFMDVMLFQWAVMKHIMNPSWPPAIVRERHKPRAPHPVIIVVSPDPDPDAERCTPLDPLTPIWTPAQSLGNNPFIKLGTNTSLLLSHNSYL